MKFVHEQETAEKQYKQLQSELEQCQETKQNLEIQLGEVNQNLLQVSETLSETTQNAEKQIVRQ